MGQLFNDDFLDALAVVGFVISIANYNENLSQSDKDDILEQFSQRADSMLQRLEDDLEEQNEMLRDILDRIDKLENRGGTNNAS